MKVGDLVRVKYDRTVGLVVRVTLRGGMTHPWIYLHTGVSYRAHKLETVNESR